MSLADSSVTGQVMTVDLANQLQSHQLGHDPRKSKILVGVGCGPLLPIFKDLPENRPDFFVGRFQVRENL